MRQWIGRWRSNRGRSNGHCRVQRSDKHARTMCRWLAWQQQQPSSDNTEENPPPPPPLSLFPTTCFFLSCLPPVEFRFAHPSFCMRLFVLLVVSSMWCIFPLRWLLTMRFKMLPSKRNARPCCPFSTCVHGSLCCVVLCRVVLCCVSPLSSPCLCMCRVTARQRQAPRVYHSEFTPGDGRCSGAAARLCVQRPPHQGSGPKPLPFVPPGACAPLPASS